MESVKVSNNMLARMPVYLNYIKSLPKSTQNISATKIADALGLGEVSVRKDLAKVSDGGRCKMGYSCDELIRDIENFLDIKSKMNAVMVGKGDFLQVMFQREGYETAGLNIVAGFDVACGKKRTVLNKNIYPLSHLESFCKEQDIRIGIILAPPEDAQEVCDQLIFAGVDGIWNFTPIHLNVPEGVVVQNESFAVSITKMKMQLKDKDAVGEL
jgi:redox-sensing transcriptional repressor